MQAKGAGELNYTWTVSDIAVIKEIVPGKLVLKRAQDGGNLTVTAGLSDVALRAAAKGRVLVHYTRAGLEVGRAAGTPVTNPAIRIHSSSRITMPRIRPGSTTQSGSSPWR